MTDIFPTAGHAKKVHQHYGLFSDGVQINFSGAGTVTIFKRPDSFIIIISIFIIEFLIFQIIINQKPDGIIKVFFGVNSHSLP